MTARDQQLCKAILQAAHDGDARQFSEVELHADANLITGMTLTEFVGAVKICESRKWLTCVPSKLNRFKILYSINSRGEAALADLNE